VTRRAFVLIGFVFFVLCGCARRPVLLNIVNGHADLSGVDLTQAVLELNGDWEYYPGQIINPEEMQRYTDKKKFAHVPGSYNRYGNPQLALPAAASATYRLTLVLPARVLPYTFRVPPPATASAVFINGNRELTNGVVSENLSEVRERTPMRYLHLPLAGKTEIIIQTSNAIAANGGIWLPISLGSAQSIDNFRFIAVVLDVFVVVGLLTFGVYHLLLFSMRLPEASSVYYALVCFAVAAGRLFAGEMIGGDILPSLSWSTAQHIELIADFLHTCFFVLYLRSFFGDRGLGRIMLFVAAVSGLFAAAAIILPGTLWINLHNYFRIFTIFISPLGFYFFARLAVRGVFGSRIIFIGLLVIFATFVNDTLRTAEIVQTPLIYPFGILGFTFLQAVLISKKSVLVSRENANLSQRLIRAEKQRDEFLTQGSNELRTPVQAMVQTLENLRRGTSGAVSEQVQKGLAVIEENGRRLLYLIDDLTDSVHIRQNTLQLNFASVSLKKVVAPVLKLSLGLSEKNDVVIVDEIPDGLDDVRVDPDRLQQIILNLISTAIRYAHSPTIYVRVGSNAGLLTLGVLYHGTEPDHRHTSTWLGDDDAAAMVVTRKLAKLMGGHYYYHKHSESQHTLGIALPYSHPELIDEILRRGRQHTEYRATGEKSIFAFAEKSTDLARGAGMRILLVSEHASQIKLLQEQIFSLDRTALIAKNAAETLIALEKYDDIALIIADVLLPDISGVELAINIRAHYDIGILPIILIIDNNQIGITASAFSAGVNDIIRRPFEKVEVLARVKNVLLQREASLARENYRALNRELEIARSIHESILPIAQPKNDLYKIEAVCLPARSIGGDFYDFIEDETSIAVMIADVAGHGIPAALYASMLKIAFHNLRDQAHFPEKLLKALNDLMIDRSERTFISCAYTLVDFKNKRLLHANAGHLPLLMQEANAKAVKKIQPPGGVLGVKKEASVTVEMLHLQPKTRLTLFTDGVIELANRKGEFFEEERLIALLEEMRSASIAELKERLLAEMRAFAEGENFLDDVTFVILDV